MSNIAISEKNINGFNEGDWDAVRSTLADNAKYSEFATGRTTDSADTWVANSRAWKNAFPNAKGESVSRVESGDTLVEELVWAGTHTGEMITPDGQTIPATNKSMKVNACMITKFSEGKIVESNHYFDMMSMLAQLGLAG